MGKLALEYLLYPLDSFTTYKYVVTVSRYQGKILLGKHAVRGGWEAQGGHVESGETTLQAAERELFEESGALEYTIQPLFDIGSKDSMGQVQATSQVFFADVTQVGDLPPIAQGEIERVACFTELPSNISFPGILPLVLKEVCKIVNWDFT